MNDAHGKSVLLISNGESITGKENTLTHFSGSIPSNFLEEHKKWKVAVHSFGFHLLLRQRLCSQFESHPAIIQVTKKEFEAASKKHDVKNIEKLPLIMFNRSNMLFVEDGKSYSSKTLMEHFESQLNQLDEAKGIPLKYDEDDDCIMLGHFDQDGGDFQNTISRLPKNEQINARTFVFLNAHFKKSLDVDFISSTEQPKIKQFRKTHIDGELYYYFFNALIHRFKDYYPFRSKNNSFNLKIPKIIQIFSPQIEHTISNESYTQCLTQFTVDKLDLNKYVHREFEFFELFEVLNNIIEGFEIKLVDENCEKIQLQQGLPSWIKLIFISKMEKTKLVKISSEPNSLHPSNKISNFSVQLKEKLDFTWTKNPKVALTRVSLNNKWQLMQGLKMNLFIYDPQNETFHNFECPKENGGPRSCEEITSWFKKLTDESSINMKKQQNGAWSFKFSKDFILILGRDLAQCLGISSAYNNKEDLFINVKKNSYQEEDESEVKLGLVDAAIDSYSQTVYNMKMNKKSFKSTGDILIFGEAGSNLNLHTSPRDIELYPNDLYIYSSIVKPTIVLGEYRRLLRIISLPYGKKDQNITIEFPHLEYHDLSELQPSTLHFEIVSIDGRPVLPLNSDDIYLSLQFLHE